MGSSHRDENGVKASRRNGEGAPVNLHTTDSYLFKILGLRTKITDLHKSLSFSPEGQKEASLRPVAKCHWSFYLSRKISF